MRLAVPLFAVPEKTARPPDFPGCCRPSRSLCYTSPGEGEAYCTDDRA